MTRKKVKIPFFTDQNVPESACRFLEQSGHLVTRLRDVMLEDSPDSVIAVACSQSGHVLVSHDKDFKSIARRLKITQRQYQNSLHRVSLRCEEPNDVDRLRDFLSLIEHEWSLATTDKPMTIEIRASTTMVYR